MQINEVKDLLILVGKKVGKEFESSRVGSPYFHSQNNCGLEIEFYNVEVPDPYRPNKKIITTRAFCTLHRLEICYCGWEIGKHYETKES